MVDTQYLYACLRRLPDTGPSGLEGLVRTLLEKWTGQRFFLARSGSQAGRDMRAERLYGNLIAVESKRYKEKSNFKWRELDGELLQAAIDLPNLDLWVLIATREVSDQDATGLQKGADRLGFETLIIDARSEGLGNIDVFFSEYPELTVDFCVAHAEHTDCQRLMQQLEDIRRDPSYGAMVEQLRATFSVTILGYDDARHRAAVWLSNHLTTRSQSKAVFGQDIGLMDPGRVTLVERVEIGHTLDNWWQNWSRNCPHFALLGEEGTGKTWAMFSWLYGRTSQVDGPMILPVTSTGLPPSAELVPLIANELHRRCGKTAEFWNRRLDSWRAQTIQGSPQCLLLFDGLNERPDFLWRRLFSEAGGNDWRGRIAIMVTCRSEFWHHNLSGIDSADFQTLTTDGYTDVELSQALAAHDLTLEQIPDELRPLIRRPRYCDLVALRFHAMVTSGDLTVDRLLYEDIKDRRLRKDGLAITDEAFRGLLGRIAQRSRDGVTQFSHTDIRTLLPYIDPYGAILQDIIDGGLFERGSQHSAPYRVERRRLIHGVGMLLADELLEPEWLSHDDLVGAVEAWFEPQPDMDMKTAICGAAVFYSLVTRDYPIEARRALLTWWIGAHNMSAEQEQAVVAYLPECPVDFLAVTERFWQDKHDNYLAQRRLAKAYLKHRDHTQVKSLLIEATQRWMGFVHIRGQPLEREPEDRNADEIARAMRKRFGTPISPGEITFHGIPLIAIDDDGLLRLARFALLIISAGDRAPFVEAFVRWAVSRELMGSALEADEVAWVLRLTDADLWSLLKSRLTDMAVSIDETLRRAAHTLLTCLGIQDALRLKDTRLQGLYPPNEWQLAHQKDPCTSFFAWERHDCESCLQREDVSLRRLVFQLQRFVVDPLKCTPSSRQK